MKFRIRGPSSQSVVNFDETTTIETLRKTVATETSLTSFEIKHGYPPKTLSLDQYPAFTLLRDLDFKLDGEQLIVSKRDAISTDKVVHQPPPANASTLNKPSSSTSGPRDRKVALKPPTPGGRTEAPASGSGFSFGNPGTAPTLPTSLKSSTPRPADVSLSTPSSLKRKQGSEMTDDALEILLPERGGALVLRVMPDDNSCLFRAVGRAVMPGLDAMTDLRGLIAEAIQADPVKYTKAVLDNKEPDDYCEWIKREDAWGGQIEIDILSREFDLEIYSIDIKSLRIDKYNEGKPKRCYIAYSLIHYDSIAFSPFDLPPEEDITQFDSSDDSILNSAVILCQQLKEKGHYTDTAAFKIRCNDCRAILTGEKGAVEHAEQTGHYNMEEVRDRT